MGCGAVLSRVGRGQNSGHFCSIGLFIALSDSFNTTASMAVEAGSTMLGCIQIVYNSQGVWIVSIEMR